MWPFSKKKTLALTTQPEPAVAVSTIAEIKRQAVREAISALGLVKPEAEDTIVRFLVDEIETHPRQTLTQYRKGEQLTKEEKNAIGLRSNAFMSRQAFDDLTEEGLVEPLRAHETVLLRATFTVQRHSTIRQLMESGIVADKSFKGVKYDVLNMDCPVCGPLHGRIIQIEEASIFPLKGCTCATANFGYRADIDFLNVWND